MHQGDGTNYAHSVSYNGSSPSMYQRSSTGRAHTEAQEDLLKVEQYIQYLKNNKNKVERQHYHSFNEAVDNHEETVHKQQQIQLINLRSSNEELITQENIIQNVDSIATQQPKAQGQFLNQDQSSRILSPTTTASPTATQGTATDTIQHQQSTQAMSVGMDFISQSHNPSQYLNSINNDKRNNQIVHSKLIHQNDSNMDQFNVKNNNFLHQNAEIKQSSHRSSSRLDKKHKKKKRENLNHLKSLVQKTTISEQIKGSVHTSVQGKYAFAVNYDTGRGKLTKGNLTPTKTTEEMSQNKAIRSVKDTKIIHKRTKEHHNNSCFRTSSDSSRNSRSTSRSSDAERDSHRRRKQRKNEEIIAQRQMKLESMKEYMRLARKDPFNWNLFIGAFTSERAFLKSDKNKDFEMLFSLTLQVLIQNLRNINTSYSFNSKSVGNIYFQDQQQKLSSLQNQLNSIIQPITSPLVPSSTKSSSQTQQVGFQFCKDPAMHRIEKKIVPQLGFQNNSSATVMQQQQQQELQLYGNELQMKQNMIANLQDLERKTIQNSKERVNTTHSNLEQSSIQKILQEQQQQRQSLSNFQQMPQQISSCLEGGLQQNNINSSGSNTIFRKELNYNQFVHLNLPNQVSKIASERLNNNLNNLSRNNNQNSSSNSNLLALDQRQGDKSISNQLNNQRFYKNSYGFDNQKNNEFEQWMFSQQKMAEINRRTNKNYDNIDSNNYESLILPQQQKQYLSNNQSDNNFNRNSQPEIIQRNTINDSQYVGIQINRNKGYPTEQLNNNQIPSVINYNARQNVPFEVRQSTGSMQSAGHFGLSTSASSAVGLFNKYPFKNNNNFDGIQANQADIWDERQKRVIKVPQNQINSAERRESQRYKQVDVHDWRDEDGEEDKLLNQGKIDKQTNQFKASSRLQKSEQQLPGEEQVERGQRQQKANGDSSPERLRANSQGSHSTKQDNLDQLNQGDLSGYELSQFDSKSNQSLRTNTNNESKAFNDDQTIEAPRSKKSTTSIQKNRLTFKSKNALTNPSDNSKNIISQGCLRESISPSNKPDDRPSHFFKAQERNEQVIPDISQIQRRAKPNVPKQTTFDIISHSQVTEAKQGNQQK